MFRVQACTIFTWNDGEYFEKKITWKSEWESFWLKTIDAIFETEEENNSFKKG
jgi:hypothetical protein